MVDYNKDDFEQILKINKYKLDEECINQSNYFFYYSDALVEAKAELNRIKSKYELIRSEVYLRIRQEREDARDGKVTEVKLSALVDTDEEVTKAKVDVTNAERVCNNLLIAVNALDSRKSELDNLVKLYCAGYFSVVTGKGKDIDEQVSSEIRKNLNN